MEIRFSTSSDLPAIVTLLKQSLGESLMPKSETYWTWKHINNPFGESPVLLALDGTRLVGVRAFMKWRWSQQGQSVESVRAVDTATHPDYQGKGIFSKLTKALLADCESKGVSFVFNTPNKLSKPGYLKMGWVEAGKLPISIHLPSPLSSVIGLAARSNQKDGDNSELDFYLKHPGLANLLLKAEVKELLTTTHNARSLTWRYKDVPVARYYACGVTSGDHLLGLVFYRLKPIKRLIELRVTDVFASDSTVYKELKQQLKIKARQHRADLITVSGLGNSREILPGWMTFLISSGPVITVKEVAQKVDRQMGFVEWQPSLGDMELF